MTTGVFLAVLFAAALHATWNGLIRFGEDKFSGMFVMSTSQGLMGLCLVPFLPLPRGDVWLYLLVSALFHSSYKAFLTFAYEQGDLSRVYPIARGTAPMLVAAISVPWLGDDLSLRQYGAIFVVGTGILLMARGVFSAGESRRLLPFAVASAAMTAGYMLTDGVGARAAGSATVFVAWMFVLDGLVFASWAVWRRGRVLALQGRGVWGAGALAGGASLAAYWIAVWAMTQAPIALVSALRETSVLFAVAIGILFFGERAGTAKVAAALLIVIGVAALRL